MNKILFGWTALCCLFICATVCAEEIDKNTAQMQAMDKITGRVSKIKVPVGGEVKFERIPLRYWGNMKEQYEAHNPDYAGVYRPEK